MSHNSFNGYIIDYVEIYAPMSKALAYWHTQALGFTVEAYADNDTGMPNVSSYVLASNDIRLVLTSSYPTGSGTVNSEISSYIAQNYCGVRRFALRTSSVKDAFEKSVANGAVPSKFPTTTSDEWGSIEEAAIRLYDHSEIVFINRDNYSGPFKPGYMPRKASARKETTGLECVDHIAAEVRINEISFWTEYLTNTIGTSLVQSIQRNEENKTGMILNINQSPDKNLTLVMAEPDTYTKKSKIQTNIDRFGPGIHHLAFATEDIISTIGLMKQNDVDFVSFPPSYYELLRGNPDFSGIDIDALEEHGILIDKEDDTYLLQKFIKPISERPFFLYEIVQRVNGYNGFALKNINVLKKAEEMEIIRADVK